MIEQKGVGGVKVEELSRWWMRLWRGGARVRGAGEFKMGRKMRGRLLRCARNDRQKGTRSAAFLRQAGGGGAAGGGGGGGVAGGGGGPLYRIRSLWKASWGEKFPEATAGGSEPRPYGC